MISISTRIETDQHRPEGGNSRTPYCRLQMPQEAEQVRSVHEKLKQHLEDVKRI